MASKTTYKDLYKYVQGMKSDAAKAAKQVKENTPQGQIESLDTQIKNNKVKLAAAGADVDKISDSRNILEKKLGLPEDQNFVFDFFELLGRPQQAVFGAINAAQKGEDVGEAALKNLKGEDRTDFKDILTEADMSDRKGKLDLVDVLGFGGDVFLDPADIIPVAGFGKAAKALKAGDSIKDASKLLKSTSDLVFEGAIKGTKGAAKLADTGIEKGLKALDEIKGVKNSAGDIVKLAYETPQALSSANLGKKAVRTLEDGTKILNNTNVHGRLETYKDIKDQINRAFNYTRNIPKNLKNAINENNAESYKAAIELKPLNDKLDNRIREYAQNVANKTGGDVDAIFNQVDKDLSNLKEFRNYNRETTVADLIKDAQNGKLTAKMAGEDNIAKIRNIADDINKADRGLSLTVDVADDGLVKLSKDWDYVLQPNKLNRLSESEKKLLKSLDGVQLDSKKLKEVVTRGHNYTEADLKEFGDLIKKYEMDEDFKKLYDDTEGIFNEANNILDTHFGTKLGETYSDNQGYVRHAFDKDYYDTAVNQGFVSPYGDTVAKGNTGILKDRLYNMSAREANNLVKSQISKNFDELDDLGKEYINKLAGKDEIFKEGMTSAFSDYLENVPKLAHESKNIDNILIKSSLTDLEELESIEKQLSKAKKAGDTELVNKLINQKTNKLNNSTMKILTNSDSAVPAGFKQLSKSEVDNLTKKLTRMGDELGLEDMKNTASFVRRNGQNLAMSKDMIRLIDIAGDKQSAKGFARLYDKYINFFKKNKVLSPTFQMNNVVGNMSNMYLAGISPTTQAKLYPQAMEVMSKGNDVMTKALQNGVESLTTKEKEIYNIWNKFTNAGFGDANKLAALNLADMPDSLKKYFDGSKSFKEMSKLEKVRDFLPYMNNKMNNYMDTASRLVTFMYGDSNPKFLERLGVMDAAEGVRKVNFDPTELTAFENDVMKKIAPFYTFTKKNLAFQLDNLSKNGSQYNKLMKSYNNLLEKATGDNENNVEDWMRNNMYIPIPGLGKDGSYKVVRATMPFGNVIETLTDPLGTGVGLVSPLAKMPLELTANVNTFTGAPIEKFEGQMSSNIPGLTKKQEYLLGGFTGLDVPIKSGVRAYEGIQDAMSNDKNFIQDTLNVAGNTLTMESSIDQDRISRMYDELDELETIMNQYKQAGVEFPTMNELKKANVNPTIDKINTTFNKLNGIKKNPYSYGSNKVTNEDLYNMYVIQ